VTGQIVIEGDCLATLRQMPARRVAVVVTSPPYNLGKKYGVYDDDLPEAEYLAGQEAVAKELARVLRPDGHAFVNVGSNSAHPLRSIEVCLTYAKHLALQNRIVWAKRLALNASALKDDPELKALPAAKAAPELFAALCDVMHERTFGQFTSFMSDAFLLSCYEDVFHFSVAGRTPINPRAEGVGVPYVFKDQPERFGHGRELRCRGNVWHIPYKTMQSRADRDYHPATFPVALVDRCLRLAAPGPDGLVLDPFAGTGATLLAARALNLNAVGIEIDPAYCAAARRRLAEIAA
jgi:site-specific DNA-methyltransferase (adenine-specific)